MAYQDSPRLLRPAQASRLYNISVQQLRNLEKSGVLRAYRHGPKGWRRFRPEDIESYLGLPKDSDSSREERRFFYYARVSTKNQAASGALQNQITRLKEYAREQYGVDDLEGLSDVASGISVDRNAFSKLIDLICTGELQGATILVTYRDRLMRLNGHGLIERICNHHGVAIEYVDEEDEVGADQELADEILRIITHFSAKKHGARGGDAVRVDLAPETVRLIFSLYQQRLSVESIEKHCVEHNVTSVKGKKISKTKIYEVLKDSDFMEQLLGKEDFLARWMKECCYVDKDHRVLNADLWENYLNWTRVNNLNATTRTYFSMWLAKQGLQRRRYLTSPGYQQRFYVGISLRKSRKRA